jgi:hypothetical protein
VKGADGVLSGGGVDVFAKTKATGRMRRESDMRQKVLKRRGGGGGGGEGGGGGGGVYR